MKKKWSLGKRIISLILSITLLASGNLTYAASVDVPDGSVTAENTDNAAEENTEQITEDTEAGNGTVEDISEEGTTEDVSDTEQEEIIEQDPSAVQEERTEQADPLENAEDFLADDEPQTVLIMEEDISQRSSNVKVFQNEDHSYTAAVYPDAVHYEENGEWKEIDNSLSDAGEEEGTQYLGNKDNLFDVKFSKKSNGKKLVKLKLDDFQVSWGLKDARKTDAMQKEELSSEAVQKASILNESNSGVALLAEEETADLLSESPKAAESGLSLEEAEKIYGNKKNDDPKYNTTEGILPEEQETWNSTNDPGEETLDPDHYDEIVDKNTETMTIENLSSNVVYEEILPGIDLEYVLVSQKIKENIIIKNADAQNSFVFQYQLHGMEPELQDGSVLFKDGEGNTIFSLCQPYAYDAAGASTNEIEITLTQGNGKKCEITVTLSEAWMKDEARVFPIVLDPTVTSSKAATAIDDTYTASTYPTSNYVYRDYLKTGVDSGGAVCRTFIGFTLPELNPADMVIQAQLNLYCYADGSEQTTVMVHPAWYVTGNSTNITWQTMPDCGTAVDYVVFTPSAGSLVSFDITELVQDWYRNGSGQNGVMLRAAQEDGQETYYISSDCSVTEGRPSLTLFYINNNGLEDYWTYHEQNAGRAGTGYVNDFNGNLTFIHDTMKTTGDHLTADLLHVYNMNDKSTNLGYGYGWRLNYQQTVKTVTISGTEYKEYTDGDGTIHYFKYDSTTSAWKVESGIDLKLTVNSSSTDKRFVITDKNECELQFDSSGNLVKIARTSNDFVSITYTSGKISKIKDSSTREMTLTYENGLLVKATHPSGQVKKFNYTNKKLTSIEDIDGKIIQFTYDSGNRLLSAQDIDGYTITYEYDSTGYDKVSRVSEKNGDTEGASLEIGIYGNATGFLDSNGISEFYRFNKAGNTIAVYNSEGQAQTTKYITEGTNTNKISKLSALQSSSVNLIKNPNLDTKTGWSYINNNATITLDTRQKNARVGNNSFYLYSESNEGKAGCRQTVSLEAGKTYTFSAYVNADESFVEKGLFYVQIAATTNAGQSLYSDDVDYYKTEDGWYRLITSLVIPDNITLSSCYVYAGIRGKGSGYLDCFQMEEGSASKYNLIQNGDFRNGLTGYTTTGTTLYDRVRVANEPGAGLDVTYRTGTITTDYLNMRTGPGTSYSSVTSLSTGDTITLIGEGTAADGKTWYYTYCIKSGQVYSGYMSSDYVSINSSKRTATKAVVDATDLNVRKGAGRGYDSLIKIDRNATLYVLSTATAATGQFWDLVYFENSGTKYVGYVLEQYIYAELFENVYDKAPVSAMDDNVFHMTGNPAFVKKLTQTLDISGKAGDVFAGSLWSCGDMTAAKDNRAYGLEVEFVALDGSSESFTSTFDSQKMGWQYLYDVFIPTKKFVKINVSCVYSYHGNMVLFDGLGFYKEDFAASYLYDSDGNVTTVQKNASQKNQFEYDNKNNLTKLIDSKGSSFTYTYNDDHDLTSAVSAENVTYRFGYDYGVLFDAETVDTTNNLSITSRFERTYLYNFNYVEGITDALGNTISYEYNNLQEGLLTKETDANDNATQYTYDDVSRKLKKVEKSYDDGFTNGTASVTYTYDNDNLKTINHNGFDYTFTYDGFGNQSGVQIAGAELISYQYADRNGNLTSVQYGNGHEYLYTYDDLNRVIQIDLKDSQGYNRVLYRYEYNKEGYLSTVYDIREDLGQDTIISKYYYDMSGRLIYIRNDHDEDYRYTYDNNDNLVKTVQGNPFRKVVTEYTYDKDNRETKTKTVNKTISTSYDNLGRIQKKEWNTQTPYTMVFEYQQGAGGATTTSNQISKITAGGVSTSYEYDGNGNITKITSGNAVNTYAYDELNQLIREDNSSTQQTICYVYDAGGNILEKRVYAYLPAKTIAELSEMTPADTVSYTYDAAYKDKLVNYDGSAITYDAIGNPLSYRGMTFTWSNTKDLRSVTKGNTTYLYRYNKDGIRNRKYLETGEVFLYQLDGSLIVGEQKLNASGNLEYELEFCYDSDDNIVSMVYNGVEYYYIKNIQGDIVGIMDASGTQIVTYTYDAWGKLLNASGNITIGNINPFRYRGYYYDGETGLYYINSRYYDPEISRFINADTIEILGVSTDLYDKNLYAYCDNNPVIRKDAGGEFWTIASGALIGAVISAGIEIGMQIVTTGKIDLVNVGIAALSGAAGGALAATGFGWFGQSVGNAAISAVTEVASQLKSGNRDLKSIAVNAGKMAAVGAFSVAIGGKGIKAKGSAYGNSLNNLNNLKGNVSKAISNPKGYRHQINRAIKNHQSTTRNAVKSTAKSFGLANLFANAVGRIKSFFGW